MLTNFNRQLIRKHLQCSDEAGGMCYMQTIKVIIQEERSFVGR